MEDFILRIVGVLCATVISCIIVITRKDDIDISAIITATILEVLAMIIIYFPKDIIISIFSKICVL